MLQWEGTLSATLYALQARTSASSNYTVLTSGHPLSRWKGMLQGANALSTCWGKQWTLRSRIGFWGTARWTSLTQAKGDS